jgi:hypothetical protein
MAIRYIPRIHLPHFHNHPSVHRNSSIALRYRNSSIALRYRNSSIALRCIEATSGLFDDRGAAFAALLFTKPGPSR